MAAQAQNGNTSRNGEMADHATTRPPPLQERPAAGVQGPRCAARAAAAHCWLPLMLSLLLLLSC